MKFILFLACLITLGYTYPNPINPNCGPLCDYVHRHDSHYEWFGPIEVYPQDGFTTYILNMTSQKWFDEDLSSRPIWWHFLAVHIPDEIRFASNGFLHVGYSDNNAGPPVPESDYIKETGFFANRTGMVAAALEQIPNQPITFRGDENERMEDAIIAWTWAEFLENDDADPEILLRMPMCKAVSRAMDTITDFVQDMIPSIHIDKYMVSGESKRGWTTWLQGVVDRRVVAIAPVVLTCLNTVENMHHYYQSFDGYPLYYIDYWLANTTSWLDDPRSQDMAEIIDPYEYRDDLTLPKLIVAGASDEIFMPDDSHYFFDDLVGDKYMWLLENTGHAVRDSPLYEDLWIMLETFYISVIEDYPRPVFTWTRDITDTGGSITMNSVETPKNVTGFWADTSDIVCEESGICRRDFRLLVNIPPVENNIVWEEVSVQDLGDNNYRLEMDLPEPGFYRAFFIKVQYDGPEERDYIFTTEANIIPDGFPFADCEGTGCRGILK